MKMDFDFDKIGRREPYTVPDNFFQAMEDRVMARIAETRGHAGSSWRAVLAWSASIAAVIAVVFTIGATAVKRPQNYAIEDVERSFARLSEADQSYLLETYRDDIFDQSLTIK